MANDGSPGRGGEGSFFLPHSLLPGSLFFNKAANAFCSRWKPLQPVRRGYSPQAQLEIGVATLVWSLEQDQR